MKRKFGKWKKIQLVTVVIAGLLLTGCSSRYAQEEEPDNVVSENVVITETGEVIEKPVLQEAPVRKTPSPTPAENRTKTPAAEHAQPTPVIDVDIPVQEQVITQEDQAEPHGYNLQLVF